MISTGSRRVEVTCIHKIGWIYTINSSLNLKIIVAVTNIGSGKIATPMARRERLASRRNIADWTKVTRKVRTTRKKSKRTL